jgi:hypothetical protein
VHSIVQEDVRAAALAVEERVAARPERRMGRGVLGTEIRFGLDDAAGDEGAAVA